MHASSPPATQETDHVKINVIARNKARRLSVQRRQRERLTESFPALFSPERMRRDEASSLARTPPSIRGLVASPAAAADSETADGREWDLYSPDIYSEHDSVSATEISKENIGNNRPPRVPTSIRRDAPSHSGKGTRTARLGAKALGPQGGQRRKTLATPSSQAHPPSQDTKHTHRQGTDNLTPTSRGCSQVQGAPPRRATPSNTNQQTAPLPLSSATSRRRGGSSASSQRRRKTTSGPLASAVVAGGERPEVVALQSDLAPAAPVAAHIASQIAQPPQYRCGARSEAGVAKNAEVEAGMSSERFAFVSKPIHHSSIKEAVSCCAAQIGASATRDRNVSSKPAPEADHGLGGSNAIFARAVQEGSVESVVLGRRVDPDGVLYIIRLEVYIQDRAKRGEKNERPDIKMVVVRPVFSLKRLVAAVGQYECCDSLSDMQISECLRAAFTEAKHSALVRQCVVDFVLYSR